MTKQEFIDKTPSNDLEAITQIFLTRLSITKIRQLKRALGEITKECPKTWMLQTSLQDYITCLTTADEINKIEAGMD